MIKALKISLLILCVIALSLAITYLSLPFIIENNIKGMTKTPVSVGAITFRSNNIYVDDFVISNPKEAKKTTALRIGLIDVTNPLEDYIKNDMVVESIHLENIYLNIELYNKQKTLGNWQTIMGNMSSDTPVPNKVNQTSTLIKKITLKDIEIDLILFDTPTKTIHIPSLIFYDIPTEDGLPAKQIAKAIVSKIVRSLFIETGVNLIIKAPVNVIKDAFSPLLSPFKKNKEDKDKKGTSK